MIYFDSQNPNKYAALKKLLVPHVASLRGIPLSKKRYGSKDGSYVLCPELMMDLDDQVLSYGIGEDKDGVSFEREIGKEHFVFCYDPNPRSFESLRGISHSFCAEALTKENFRYHCAGLESSGNNNILKIDIEGCEYDWLTNLNMELVYENFAQVTIEVHGLIEEVPEGWVIEPAILDAKKNLQKKIDFFSKLNQDFILFHIHANNHGPRYVDFPDSLELTYLRKPNVDEFRPDLTPYPKVGLDEPNFDGREEYLLDWWI